MLLAFVFCVQQGGLYGNKSYHSILDNYTTLLELWDVILEMQIDSDVRARVHGVSSQM